MRVNLKKTCLLSLLVLGVFATAGCGSSNSGEKTADGKDVVQLKFTYWGDSLEKTSIEELIKNFNKEHEGIKVTPQQIPGDNYMEKLNTMASTNSLPDVGYMKENNMYEWGTSGKIKDLSDMYKDGGAFSNKLVSNVFQFEENGPIYGSSVSIGMSTLLYNGKYFEENGVEVPPYQANQAQDWDSFVEMLQQLTVDRNGKHPNEDGFDEKNIETYGVNNFTWLYEMFMKSNGGGLVSDDGKQILIGKEESIDALQKIHDLMYVHHVMPMPSQASTIPATDTAMLTNRVAVNISGSWDLRGLGEAVEKKGLNLGIGVLPKMGEESLGQNFGVPIVVFENDNTKENWEETQTFLEYVMAPENSLPIINSGLWQPNQEDWYTETDKIEKWTTNEFSPDHMKEALLDTTVNNVAQNKAFYFKDTATIEQIVNPALDQLWTNKKDAKEVVSEDIIPKLEKEFGDEYEIIQ